MVVSVRRFLKGVDEPVWVELLNAEYHDYASWWRGTTVEENLLDFSVKGRVEHGGCSSVYWWSLCARSSAYFFAFSSSPSFRCTSFILPST